MSIIVDTSVWSHVLRRGIPSTDPQVERLVRLLNQGTSVSLLGVILQEILQGIRKQSDFDKVREHLAAFPLIALGREDYVAAAELRNHCMSHGINAGTIDFQIAAACIQHKCPLLTCDADFTHIASVSPLQLL